MYDHIVTPVVCGYVDTSSTKTMQSLFNLATGWALSFVITRPVFSPMFFTLFLSLYGHVIYPFYVIFDTHL